MADFMTKTAFYFEPQPFEAQDPLSTFMTLCHKAKQKLRKIISQQEIVWLIFQTETSQNWDLLSVTSFALAKRKTLAEEKWADMSLWLQQGRLSLFKKYSFTWRCAKAHCFHMLNKALPNPP